MKHKIYILTLAAALLTGCANDDFVGPGDDGEAAINFGIVTGGATRAEKTGADAAADLGGSFVVYADKSADNTEGGVHKVVFDYYNVTFVDGTANSTVSNYKGWEYVGVTPVNNAGTTTIEDFDPVTNQTIKYWDKTQIKYDFYAFSKGKGNASFSKVNTANLASSTDPVYSIMGTYDDLTKAFIADVVEVTDKNEFSREHPVTPKFRSAAAKLRIGIYETIPGYSVKDIKFYADDASTTTTPIENACLFASSRVFPTTGNGVINVYFPDAVHAKTEFVSSDPDANSRTLTLSPMVLGAEKESYENAVGPFIGRTSATATYTNVDKLAAFKNVGAIGSGHALSIKVDYTLVPTDGQTGGEITIKGTTATVPDIYTDWQPNYAYTYIFKISDDSGDGLYPIAFDAAEIVDGGPHETDTENSGPSITTYQNGINVTENNEYLPGKPIYTIVGNYNTMSITAADYWKEGYIHLFKATVEEGAVQGIDELSVSNCFTYGTYDATAGTYTVTDIKGKKLVLTDVSSLLTVPGEIPATDGPNGTAVTKADAIAKIANPEANTVYVFQYLDYPAEYAEVPFNTLKKGAPMYCVNMGEDWMRFILKGYADGTEPIHDALYYNPENSSYKIIKEYSFDATPFGDDLKPGTSYYKVEEETYNLDGVDCPAFKYSIVTAASGDVNNGNYYKYDDKQVMFHLPFSSYTDEDFITLATGQDCYMIDSDTRRYTRVVAKGIETSTGKAVTTQPRHVYKVIRTGSAPVTP